MVGEAMLRILESRRFPVSELTLYSSERNAGIQLPFHHEPHAVQVLNRASKHDLVLVATGTEVSKEWSPQFEALGATVVDNSAAFRMHTDHVLCVPEVNAHALKSRRRNIIANPNCSAIQLLVTLNPLHQIKRLQRVQVATYQSISGAGRDQSHELLLQTHHRLNAKGGAPPQQYIPGTLAFNLLMPWKLEQEHGFQEEEAKIMEESKKILSLPDLLISTTCVRVPVMNAHAQAISAAFENPITPQEAKTIFEGAAGIRYSNVPPEPIMADGKDDVIVGRLRQDPSVPEDKGLLLWNVGDNLRKGAALNAIQIAEAVFETHRKT